MKVSDLRIHSLMKGLDVKVISTFIQFIGILKNCKHKITVTNRNNLEIRNGNKDLCYQKMYDAVLCSVVVVDGSTWPYTFTVFTLLSWSCLLYTST